MLCISFAICFFVCNVFFFWYCFVSDDVLGKLWGWERLLLLYGSVEWSNYSNYLAEYYNQNAYKFLADVVSEHNHEDSLLDPAARAVQIDTTAGSSLAVVVANRVSNPPASLLKHRMSN